MTSSSGTRRDVLDAHLRYHLANGVDHVIVTDNLSRDRTPEILAHHQREGRVSVLHEPADHFAQAKWVTRMARRAHLEHGADWVINSDADEFWWPRRGSLTSSLAGVPAQVGIVPVPRADFVPVTDDGRPFFRRMTIRERHSANALGRRLAPKVCHRGRADIELTQGNHAVSRPRLAVLDGPAPLEILHFPLRTFAQFERKIVQGAEAYERNLEVGPEVGDAWRHLYRLHRDGTLRDYYDRKALSGARIEAGLRSGVLVRDRRLHRFMASLATSRDAVPGAG
ncbi:MAG: glycosyltransferase family 2 protein [Thermoanaerobaculia bacterium]